MNYNKNIKEIKRDIEAIFKVQDLGVKSRKRMLVIYRYLFYFLCREYNKKASLERIGKEVNRDHSSVSHGLSEFDNLIKYYPAVKEVTRGLIKKYNDERINNIYFDYCEVTSVNLLKNEIIIKEH